MNIQELCKEIDKQYNLYTSMEGADEESCNKLLASVSNLIESGEDFDKPDFMDYYRKLFSILQHMEEGVVVKSGVKLKYTRSEEGIKIQII